MKHQEKLYVFMGILALIVFIYRFFYLMIPMLFQGIRKNNIKIIMDSLTLLV